MTRISCLTVNLIWRVNPFESDCFSYSSLVLLFQFHLLILYAVHGEMTDAFSFFFFVFYVFHCGLHSTVHDEKANAFFFLFN